MLYLNTSGTIGHFEPNKFRIADAHSVDFVPIMAFSHITRNGFYYFPSMEDQHLSSINRSAKDLIRALQSRENFAVVSTVDNQRLYVGKGLVLDPTGRILLCLTVKGEAYFRKSPGAFSDDRASNAVDYEEFILFLSPELMLTSSYSSIYKMLQKNYIDICYEKGVEVRTLSSHKIEQNTFANEFKIDFNTISEMDYCLKNEVKLLLSSPDDYFINHPMFIKGAPIPVLEEVTIGYPPPVSMYVDELEDLPF